MKKSRGLIFFTLLVALYGCKETDSKVEDYCEKYVGSWDFHYSVTTTRSGPPMTIYGGSSLDYQGSISKGFGINTINVIYASSATKANLKVEDDGQILNTCGVNVPLHWSEYCNGFFQGDSIFHYTTYSKSPPNNVVETIYEITGIRTGRGITFKAPGAVTGPVSGQSASSVTLNGSVNPNQSLTTVVFQYGPGSGAYFYAREAGNGKIGGTGFTDVSVTLTGLAPGITFYYRIKATNEYGITYGNEMSFTTGN